MISLIALMALRPLRILPLGDSITQGGRADRPEYTYRLPLYRMLKEEKVEFEFVGSMTAGLQPEAIWPSPFDPHHEGHYGWKTAQVRDHLAEWMPKWSGPPDIALIHLGTNDQGSDPQTAIVQPLTDIVGMLRKANPKVVVLVGQIDFNGGAALQIHPAVAEMAKSLNQKGSPVIAVDHYKGWVEDPSKPDSDTFDWAHPNPKGQEKMAQNWLRAMRPYLKPYRS
jgi:lysophospholipase L1-like esterase